MAKTLQIRNVPDVVHRTLQVRATAAGMSLSQYLLEELTRVAARSNTVEVLERAANLAPGLSTTAIVEAVRAGREERDAELFQPPARRRSKVAEH